MKKLVFIGLLGLLVLPILSGFTFKSPTKKLVFADENINVYTSTITGANDVEVIFERTGPDAGCCSVNISYTVRFNGHSSEGKFTKTMSQGETSATDHIQGPNPTADAEVSAVSWTY